MDQDFEHEKRKEREKFYFERQYKLNAAVIAANVGIIEDEIEWMLKILDHRIEEIKNKDLQPLHFSETLPPDLTNVTGFYADFVNEMKLTPSERLILVTAFLPHFGPEIFTNKLRSRKRTFKTEYPELGGYVDSVTNCFIPTLQTILHMLSGEDNTNGTFYFLTFFGSVLLKEQVITLRRANLAGDETGERNQLLTIAPEYVNYFISGQKPRPDFGKNFPATFINTTLEWKDLVLRQETLDHVNEVLGWLKHSKELNKIKKLKSGYPCLFWGPSGTGKTLTASLLGKSTGKDVFRVDLSMIVSKYVGETEKNLAHLFDRAENKDCILFFDEADSLFSKRTDVNSSNDKWANLEVSYLLQRMEDYPGLTILATNLKNNLDSAMTRRFQAMIFFGMPRVEERIKLWETALPEGYEYVDVSFEKLAKFDMTGANIANIIKFCCVEALTKGDNKITVPNLSKAIRREFVKENRTP